MLVKLFLFFIFSLISISSYASTTPVIFYSDLTSGPSTSSNTSNGNGVYVTIWGNNFGTSQGSSTVTVGGGSVAGYQTWTNTEICFQLGSSSATGNIVVITSNGTSNGVPFTVRSGNIYFVNTSVGTNGSGSFSSPFNHLSGAFNVHVAGDTIYVRAGTISNEYDCHPGWHSICAENYAATSTNPIAWVAYPNETVTLNAQDATSTYPDGGDTIQYVFRSVSSAWITISKFTMTCTASSIGNAQACVSGDTGWRVVGNNMSSHNEPYDTIDFANNNVEILGNEIHDSHVDSYNNQTHSIYWDAPGTTDEIAYNYLHGNYNQGWEISVYHNGPKTGKIHHNRILDTNPGDTKGILGAGCTDDPSGGDSNATTENNNIQIYDNIIKNAGIFEYGGSIQASCGTAYIYNNTVYSSGTETKGMIQFGNTIGPGGGHPVWYVANNILYDTEGGLYISDGNGNAPVWTNFNILQKNNYYSSDSAGNGPTQDTTAINANPVFVTNFTDFHLQVSSPDIGVGYNTNSIVPTDFDGVTRGNPPSVGAYEYSSYVPPPPPAVVSTDQWRGTFSGTFN